MDQPCDSHTRFMWLLYSLGLLFVSYPYFSFMTLTSVGYGDITPVTDQPQLLAIFEAIAGILLVAVLIERVVSAYRSEPTSGE